MASMEDVVSLAKRRGFVYQGSEIYGGLAGTWDYGPLGTLLKRNIVNAWLKFFVDGWEDMYQIDSAILMNPKVWQASGHVDTFTDPVIDCENCKTRFRVDQIVEDKDKYFEEGNKYFEESISAISGWPKSRGEYSEEQVQKLREIFGEARVPATEDNLSEGLIKYLETNQKLHRFFLGTYPHVYLTNHQKCEKCGLHTWGEAREFNLMLKSPVGLNYVDIVSVDFDRISGSLKLKSKDGSEVDVNIQERRDTNSAMFYDRESAVFLRPETAQGMFINYRSVLDTFSPNLPFGIAQIGKAFRNEISPRDWLFRQREFEQMEIQYFINPSDQEKIYEKWRKDAWKLLTEKLNIDEKNLRWHEHTKQERAHYAKAAHDIEFNFPFGFSEIWGTHNRTDYDLQAHQKASGKSMVYTPKDGGESFVPYVIESSVGLDRLIMAVLFNAYSEDEQGGEKRTFLKLPAELAPYKIAVCPLAKNKPELVDKAKQIYKNLKKEIGNVMWVDTGNIGKNYRRADEIGVPKFITVDFQTLDDDTVTVRDRDTTEQKRLNVSKLSSSL